MRELLDKLLRKTPSTVRLKDAISLFAKVFINLKFQAAFLLESNGVIP